MQARALASCVLATFVVSATAKENVTVTPHDALPKEALAVPVATADLGRPRSKSRAAQKLYARQSGQYDAVDQAKSAGEHAAASKKAAKKAVEEPEEPAAPTSSFSSASAVPAASTNASARAINFLPPGARFDPPSAAAGKGFEQGNAAKAAGRPTVARGGNESAKALAAKPTVQPAHIFDHDFTKDGQQQYTKEEWERGGGATSYQYFSSATRASALGLVILALAAALP